MRLSATQVAYVGAVEKLGADNAFVPPDGSGSVARRLAVCDLAFPAT